jgi:hypothetical protein
MTTQAQQDQSVRVSKPKVYQKPTLVKGPTLSRITAVNPATSNFGGAPSST